MDDVLKAWAKFCQSNTSEAGVQRLAHGSQRRDLAAKATLIEQDEPGSTVYLVVSGKLKAVQYSSGGHEIWLADIEQDELTGEMAVLDQEGRSSDVLAVQPSSLISISQHLFLNELDSGGPFALAVTRMLARRLKRTSLQLSNSVAINVSGRLHGELIRIAEPMSAEEEPVFEIDNPPSVSALAKRIHATREATSRAMSALERQGLVSRSGSTLRTIAPRGPFE
ncbi:MAG: Crp/Fnr family transcriptional regulator [Pseudomonadota bacterium]